MQIAAYAKRHLEIGRDMATKLPKFANRALLVASECEYYLRKLQDVNFDVFNNDLVIPSRVSVPYRMFMHAKNNSY